MSEPISQPCKLCRVLGMRQTDDRTELVRIWGCRCREFWVDLCDYDDFLARESWLETESRRALSALLCEQKIRNGRPVLLQVAAKTPLHRNQGFVPLSYDELAATWPQSVADRLDRMLLNAAALSPTGGSLVTLNYTVGGRDLALVFARTDDEAQYHVKALIQQERLEPVSHNDLNRVKITPRGWERVAELQSNRSSRKNPVFVAMWFGGEESKVQMDAVWAEIRAACISTGWKAIRADSAFHNDFIMNKILGDIRRSPFVIADFTGNRNGVYLEAGFARGLGIPVMHTCKVEDFEQAHFDIKQINTIKWRTVADLREGVTQWIRGTIGEGPEPIPNPAT
jgi:hypothetical protein